MYGTIVDLLEKYWLKLIRSYAADSLTTVSVGGQASQQSAQVFLDHLQGTREVSETGPGSFAALKFRETATKYSH